MNSYDFPCSLWTVYVSFGHNSFQFYLCFLWYLYFAIVIYQKRLLICPKHFLKWDKISVNTWIKPIISLNVKCLASCLKWSRYSVNAYCLAYRKTHSSFYKEALSESQSCLKKSCVVPASGGVCEHTDKHFGQVSLSFFNYKMGVKISPFEVVVNSIFGVFFTHCLMHLKKLAIIIKGDSCMESCFISLIHFQ